MHSGINKPIHAATTSDQCPPVKGLRANCKQPPKDLFEELAIDEAELQSRGCLNLGELVSNNCLLLMNEELHILVVGFIAVTK